MFLRSLKISKEFNEIIKKDIFLFKEQWKKDLKNVKALTSGFNPSYSFFDILKKDLTQALSEITKIKLKPSTWWANYYEVGHFADPHIHRPEYISSIIFIKIDETNPLYFDLNPGILNVEEEEGLILSFDSNILHGVKPCKNSRITLAMDFVKDEWVL